MGKKLLAFNTILADDLHFQAGTWIPAGSVFSLFTNYENAGSEAVTAVKETSIVRYLFSSCAKRLILNELQLEDDSSIHYEVRAPVVSPGGRPGDIDVLICQPSHADTAIGLQCKRVKVEALDQGTDKINKLPDVSVAVRQANLQRQNFGFHKNYLVVIIETYGPSRTQSNVAFRGPTSNTFKEIYEFPQRETLHDDVGVLFIQLTQPTGKSFRRMYELGVCLDKQARPLEQTSNLTNRIKELIETRAADS
ncbi:MAG: hypothetical protein ACRD9S_10650 [Pyrinomonadaceae bacterium]